MRRKIGPAYERCPADKVGRWLSDNFMLLVSAVIVGILFCYLINSIIALMNFLATNGKEDAEPPFTTTSSIVSGIKVVGGGLAAYLVCLRRAK